MRAEMRYEVTVWNQSNGDVEAYRREATEEELAQLQEWYEDEPFCEVVIDNEWEAEVDGED